MPAAKMVRCEPCDLSFESDADLYTHVTYSRHHALDCFRCKLSFNSTAELKHHWFSPPKHNLCYACDPPPDFVFPEQLSTHEAEVHNVCAECHMAFDRHDDLEYHTETQHRVCRTCKRKFGSASILANHSLIHGPTYVPCYGCPRMFSCISEMVFHLESGSCKSGADVRTVDMALKDSQFAHHITTGLGVHAFRCPQDLCDMAFRFMSGVLEHVESEHSGELNYLNNFEDFQGAPSPLDAFLTVLKNHVRWPPENSLRPKGRELCAGIGHAIGETRHAGFLGADEQKAQIQRWQEVDSSCSSLS